MPTCDVPTPLLSRSHAPVGVGRRELRRAGRGSLSRDWLSNLRKAILSFAGGRRMAAKSNPGHLDREKIDAKLDAERARLVALLRRLADRLEAAPLSRVSDGLAW